MLDAVVITVSSSSEVLCPAPAASCSTNDPNIPFQVDWAATQAGPRRAAPARSGKTCNKGGEGEMVLCDADTEANWPNGFSNTQGLFAVNLWLSTNIHRYCVNAQCAVSTTSPRTIGNCARQSSERHWRGGGLRPAGHPQKYLTFGCNSGIMLRERERESSVHGAQQKCR